MRCNRTRIQRPHQQATDGDRSAQHLRYDHLFYRQPKGVRAKPIPFPINMDDMYCNGDHTRMIKDADDPLTVETLAKHMPSTLQ